MVLSCMSGREGDVKGQVHAPVSARGEAVARMVVESAYAVHKELGPGLLESVYEACFCHELTKRGAGFQRQLEIPISYDGILIDAGLAA